jgi:hypothetical protein
LSLRAAALPRVWSVGSEGNVNVICEGNDISHDMMTLYISIPYRALYQHYYRLDPTAIWSDTSYSVVDSYRRFVFYSQGGSNTFLRTVGARLTNYTSSVPRTIILILTKVVTSDLRNLQTMFNCLKCQDSEEQRH